ncbi:MAG: hypothetical protein ABI609_01085 [Acidobacteriota bacterium]
MPKLLRFVQLAAIATFLLARTAFAAVDVTLSQAPSTGAVDAQESYVYALTVTNIGSTAAAGVAVSDTVPSGTIFKTAGSSAGWSCANGAVAGTVCTNAVGALGAGASAVRNFAVTALYLYPPSSDPGPIANTACASAPGDVTPANNCRSNSLPTTYTHVSLIQGALVDHDGDGQISCNDEIHITGFIDAGSLAQNVQQTGLVDDFFVAPQVPDTTTSQGWAFSGGSAATNTFLTTCNPLIIVNGQNTGDNFLHANVNCPTLISPNQGRVGDVDFLIHVVGTTSTLIVDGIAHTTDGFNLKTNQIVITVANPCPPPQPNMALTKTSGPSPIAAGQTLISTLAYSNIGGASAPGVVLTETVPANTTFTTTGSSAGWSCANGAPAGSTCTLSVGTVAAGGSGSRAFAAVVASPIPAGVTTIGNSACSSTTGSDSNPANNCSTTSTPVGGPNMTLSKSALPNPVAAGQTLTYTLSFQNLGNLPSSNTILSETVPANTTFTTTGSSAGWSCANGAPAGSACTLNVGTLVATASGSRTFAVVVASPIPAGVTQIGNSACARPTPPGEDTNPANDCGSASTPTAAPNMTLTKTASPSPIAAGQTLTYTLAYANSGTAAATGVVLSETVPANTTFTTTGSSAGWSCANGAPAGTACTLSVGTVAAAGSGSKTFAVVVASPIPAGVTSIGNSACAHPTPPASDSNPANDCSTITTTTASPNLALTKTASPSPITAGGTLTYTLAYANTGTGAAPSLTLNETVPANTSFTTTGSSAGWSCANGSPAGTACVLSVGSVAAGGSGSKTFAVVVASPLPAGVTSVGNTACAAAPGDSDASNDCSSVTTPASGHPDMVLTKTATPSPVAPGQALVYTLNYQNNGNASASAVVLTEAVPNNTSFTTTGSSAGWSCANGSPAGTTCTNSVGALAGSASGSKIFTVLVDNPLPSGVTAIGNTACAHPTPPSDDANPANDCGSVSTPSSGQPDISLTKQANPSFFVPGSVVVYTLVVANNGDQDGSGVVLQETVPLNTTFNSASSSPGWSCSNGAVAGTACQLSIGTLIAGAVENRLFAVNIPNPLPAGVSQIANAACAQTTPPNDANAADNCATVSNPGGAPDVHINKTASPTPVAPGGDLTYTLAITNAGNAAADNVVAKETVPANTTFLPGSSSAGWSCSPDDNAGATCTNSLGSLNGGSAVNLTFVVHVADPLPAGVTTIGNTACVDSTFNPNPNPGPGARRRTQPQGGAAPVETCSTVTPPVGTAVNLSITKDDHGVSARAGDTVVYFLDYSNIGNRNATGVVLTETVPAHTTFNAASSTAGWSCTPDGSASSTCTLTLGALAKALAGEALFAVTIESPTTATAILNTTSIADDGAQGPDADLSNNTASDTTPILTSTAHDIPTLGGLGLLLLAAGIVALAIVRLRAH